jgi:hypothetical protein
MKWQKLGKIFDPADYVLVTGRGHYAQSPQALVFADRVRVYFSTRTSDAAGKYLSHISFVDFDKTLRQIKGLAKSTVIPLGGFGCFDEHGIFPMNVVRHANAILAYTSGCSRRVSVPVDTAIGLAFSRDEGMTFEKVGTGPILGASLHEPFLVGDPFVAVFGDVYHMWYIYGLRWLDHCPEGQPQRVYKIAHAISRDGTSWSRESRPIIVDRLNPDECQALPTVIEHKGAYHMYFCYREATGFRDARTRGYRIGYAWSTDLVAWTRDDRAAGIELSDTGWDSEMMCYPHVFHCDDEAFMLYNGNEFGRHGFGVARLCQEGE